ncbi:hypothetical protein E3A20_00320 [Planctomyces bekefii]|uniref:Uncharacterized protein n=1 Tax=Planctomyces bekefii TaxID=1653850 RepID=A0A5C6MCT9_9PLAN|nr:hypothetical protein E3A20_00320 [Planctomyces bekefii]
MGARLWLGGSTGSKPSVGIRRDHSTVGNYMKFLVLPRGVVGALLGPVFLVLLVGWVRPSAPAPKRLSKPTKAQDSLDYMLLEVNGKSRMVRNGDELVVVRGDVITVRQAALVGRAPLKEVHVVGLPAAFKPNKGSDRRDVAFRTSDLDRKLSEEAKGEVFAVTALTQRHLAGAVYLRLIDPVLRYVEISINGQKRVLRDGEAFQAKSEDQFKVDQVITNIEGTSDVSVQVAPLSEQDPQVFEMRFLRSGQVFARIPMRLGSG